jgi:Transposase DDE domain group 1
VDGEAQIAERIAHGRRLIVRRTRLVGPQAELWPDWRHFPFITNRTEALEVVEAEHRQHAVVELTIRDLKDQALAHFPSGQFNANSAWTVIACLAHNLLRWSTLIGLPGETARTARTLRRRLLQIPGRLTRTGRKWTLHLPARAGRGRVTSRARSRAYERCPPPAERRRLASQRTESGAAPGQPDHVKKRRRRTPQGQLGGPHLANTTEHLNALLDPALMHSSRSPSVDPG